MAISPVIERLAREKNWDGLYQLFQRMSNTEFRRTESVIREMVMPRLENDLFWETYHHLLIYRHQAFLPAVTAVKRLAHNGQLSFTCPSAVAFGQYMVQELPDERMKMIRMVIGLLETEEQITGLFSWLEIDQPVQRISSLLPLTTPVAYYIMFQTLRHAEGDRALVLRCCRALMLKSDDLSFNMVAILREYFGLSELKNTLSLRIQPYELSYIDSSYANFEHVLMGKRPR